MAKKGDIVRYLNSVGGGVITRIEGRLAYVEEDGFENPVLLSELVVTLPAEQVAEQKKGPKLMFDQTAYDLGKKTPVPTGAFPKKTATTPAAQPETAYGNRLSLQLVFEPDDIKSLSTTRFTAVLANDSNYNLLFHFSARRDDENKWKLIYAGELGANELIDLASFRHDSLLDYEHIALQAVAFKTDKKFEIKPAVNFSRRLDLTKFHKVHCFKSNPDFSQPVFSISIITDDKPGQNNEIPNLLKKELTQKFQGDNNKIKKPKPHDPAQNPHKLLPLVEVDLHIAELTDSISGLSPKDMLEMQLREVEQTMKKHEKRIGQKIVFIHGKGNGVLRKAILDLLRKKWPKTEVQDASFQEYGFGASLITIK